MDFDSFKNKWLGKRVMDPLLISNREETVETAYQCVSLVKQYMLEVKGIKVDYPGNAIQMWTQTKQQILTAFYQVSNSAALKGDIVILWGLNGNSYGHVGIATGNITPTKVEILEQNGQTGNGTGTGGDAIRTRYVDRSRVAGLLRPVEVSVQVPTNPVLSHEQVSITKVCNKQPTNWYNLNGITFEQVAGSISGTKNQGDLFPVGGIIHHINGQTYAMSPEDYDRFLKGDRSTFNGINFGDLDDYVPPKPAPLPAAPMPAKMAETYQLKNTVMYFKTSYEAQELRNPVSTINAGMYYVYEKVGNAWHLSRDNMVDDKYWVNISQDAEPAPEPAKSLPSKITEAIQTAATKIPSNESLAVPGISWEDELKNLYHDFAPFGQVEYYNSINSRPLLIEDLSGRPGKDGKVATTTLPPLTKNIAMLGTVDIEYEGGRKVRYLVPRDAYARKMFYAVPMQYCRQSILEKALKAINDIKASEHLTALQERIKLSIQGFTNKKKG